MKGELPRSPTDDRRNVVEEKKRIGWKTGAAILIFELALGLALISFAVGWL